MNNFKAIIFDMDGVIIDSEPFHSETNNQLLKEFGIALSEEEVNQMIGKAENDVYSGLIDKYNLPIGLEEMKAESFRLTLQHLHQNPEIKPIVGIPELIHKFKDEGKKLAVASSSRMEYIELVLEMLNLKNHFPVLVSGVDLVRSKPDPTIFKKTAELLSEPDTSCLVIEDSYNGVKAAKAANMYCIGYQNRNSGNQDLSQADMVVQSISEILKI